MFVSVQCLDSNAFGDGAVLGCDFCGIVELVGGKVTRVKVGDRVAGLVWGGEFFCSIPLYLQTGHEANPWRPQVSLKASELTANTPSLKKKSVSRCLLQLVPIKLLRYLLPQQLHGWHCTRRIASIYLGKCRPQTLFSFGVEVVRHYLTSSPVHKIHANDRLQLALGCTLYNLPRHTLFQWQQPAVQSTSTFAKEWAQHMSLTTATQMLWK